MRKPRVEEARPKGSMMTLVGCSSAWHDMEHGYGTMDVMDAMGERVGEASAQTNGKEEKKEKRNDSTLVVLTCTYSI